MMEETGHALAAVDLQAVVGRSGIAADGLRPTGARNQGLVDVWRHRPGEARGAGGTVAAGPQENLLAVDLEL